MHLNLASKNAMDGYRPSCEQYVVDTNYDLKFIDRCGRLVILRIVQRRDQIGAEKIILVSIDNCACDARLSTIDGCCDVINAVYDLLCSDGGPALIAANNLWGCIFRASHPLMRVFSVDESTEELGESSSFEMLFKYCYLRSDIDAVHGIPSLPRDFGSPWSFEIIHISTGSAPPTRKDGPALLARKLFSRLGPRT